MSKLFFGEAIVSHRNRTTDGREKGVALIIALVVLFLLSALAATFIFATQSQMWSTANYRLLTQSRYAAEAGAEGAKNFFNHGGYTAPTSTTPFNMATTPVLCVSGCTTTGSGATAAITLSSVSGGGNYPVAAVQTAFVSALGSKTLSAMGNATFSVTAKLLSMQSATTQTWQITSVGSVPGAKTAATQVIETIRASVTPLFQYSVYATGSGCSNPVAITMSGSSYTDAYNSGAGAYGGTNVNDTAGSVGTNGNVVMSGGSLINGTLYGPNTNVGSCPDTLTSSASGGAAGSPGVTGGLKVGTVPTYTAPAALSPAPAVGSSMQTSGSCWATGAGCTNVTVGCSSGKCISLAPTSTSGYTYGDVQASGGTTIYLSAGTYNMNSLVLSGGSPIVINSGPVVLNIQGIKQSSPLTYEQTAVDMSGGSVTNNTGVPANFEIVCCGNAPAPPNGTNPGQNYCPGINLSGGSGSDAVVYAPNAGITMSGSSAFYGAVIGNTFTDSGGAAIHYDTALESAFPIGGSGFSQIGFTWSKN